MILVQRGYVHLLSKLEWAEQKHLLHGTPDTCLQLFVGNALISLGAEEVRNMRPKLRVMLVRFIAKVSQSLASSPTVQQFPTP